MRVDKKERKKVKLDLLGLCLDNVNSTRALQAVKCLYLYSFIFLNTIMYFIVCFFAEKRTKQLVVCHSRVDCYITFIL